MIEIFLHNRTLRHILVHNQLFFDRESLGLTNVDGEKTYVSESSDGYMISKKIYVSQNLNWNLFFRARSFFDRLNIYCARR